MNFSTLCKGICPHRQKAIYKSQIDYMVALFIAAGERFIYSEKYISALYNGYKPFTCNLKAPYRTKINLSTLSDFYCRAISDAQVSNVLCGFGIPEKVEPDKKALAVALAKQTKAIIDSDENDVDNIIGLEYQQAKSIPDNAPSVEILKALYPGDGIYVSFNPSRSYTVGGRDDIHHEWVLQNTGMILWTKRKLVYRRGPKDRPDANPSEIPIPDTSAKAFVHLRTVINGRGFDAVTRCIWDMVDEDGENCFPNQDNLFCVTIDAKFRR